MKKYATETYGIPFFLSVPSTYEEYAEAHGNANACLENAVSNDVNHNILNKIRAALADKLVSLGYPKDTTTNAKGEIVDVKPDKKWFSKAIQQAGWDAATATAEAQAISDEIGYDVSSQRGQNAGPSQKDLKDATGVIDAINAGQSTFDRVRTNIEARNPGLELETLEDGTFTAESLAAGLAYERRRIESERKAQTNALLG